MDATILGSGEVSGVPPLFADLGAADADARRRRPGLLVESDDATVLLDVSPDLHEQVHEVEVDSLDAALLTHFHHDHAGGIDDLGLVAPHLDIDVWMTETALGHCREERRYLLDDLPPETFEHGDRISVGDLTVIPFPVAHGRPEFDTVGFAVECDGTKVVYAPDIERFCPDRPAGDAYRDADLLFVDGSPVFRDELFAERDYLGMLADANAERTVLVHVNEFLDG
jgi:phosphoribosyl 1,2-cyclic phosphate phosphodiesterase